jgi:hypothetical protein
MLRSRLWVVFAAAALSSAACKGGEGNGGGGGTGGGNAGCPANMDDLISDFGSDNSLHAADGRQGGWYTYGDDRGMFTPASGFTVELLEGNPNCSGGGSLHVKGTGFSMWGAATGVDFKPRPSDGDGGYADKMVYDASKYRGIAFWAKAAAPVSGVQVSFPDIYTDGGAPPHDMPDPFDASAPPLCMASSPTCKCVYTAGAPNNCSPYLVQFGRKGDAAADVLFSGYSNHQIDTTWKRFQVLFVDTRQDPGNGGYHTPADKLTVDKLTAMAIQINADYSTGVARANDFDIWLDDVHFLR